MSEGDKQAIDFFKKKRLLKLVQETETLLNDLDVTYDEVSGW